MIRGNRGLMGADKGLIRAVVRLWPLVIFTLALGIRFIFLSQFQNNPFFQTDARGLDPSLYHEWAKELAHGYWPGHRLLYGHPFYPYIVSFFYRFWAVDSYSAITLQLVLGAFTCVFIYIITKKIFCYQAGIISSFIAALYGPFLFYEGLMVPNALAIFLNMAALFMLLNVLDFLPNQRRTFLAGLLLGCSLITNSGIAPFIILAAAWILFVLKKDRQRAAAHIMCLLFAVILPVFMMSFKHFVAEGHFDSFGAHGGINFYIGNNPDANGAFSAPLGFTPSAEGLSEDSAKYACRAQGRSLTAAGVSRFWYKKAFSYIEAQPARWLRLLYRKFVLFWNNPELGDVADYYFTKDNTFILRFNPLSFGLVAAFGVLGMILAGSALRSGFILYAGIISFLLSCELFFVNSRYRLSAVPYLAMFAGLAVWIIFKKIMSGDFKRLTLYAIIAGLVFMFSNVKAVPADTCTPRYNLSVIYEKKGQYDKAIEISRNLLKEDWNLPMVHLNLGTCYYKKNMKAEAEAEFREAVKLSPDDKDSHFNLGVIYYEKKDYNAAFAEFRSALRGNEKDIAPYYWLGNIYRQRRDFNSALMAYNEALKINPEVIEVKKAVEELKRLQKSKK